MDDKALSLEWDVDPTACEFMGDYASDETLRRMITQVAIIGRGEPGRRIHLSLSKQWYRYTRSMYRPSCYSYENVKRAIEIGKRMGWLELWKAPPFKFDDGRQSTIRATDALLEMFPSDAVTHDPPLVVIRKRGKKNDRPRIDYRPNRQSRTETRQLEKINAWHGSVRLSHPDYGEFQCGQRYDFGGGGQYASFTLYRSYSGDLKSGGRTYGHIVQGMSSAARLGLQIDGEPVTEYDYDHIHIRFAYASIGEVYQGDPYIIGNYFPRKLTKTVVQTCINAKNRRDAMQSAFKTALEMADEGELAPEIAVYGEIKRLIALIMKVHARIKHLFFSDSGVRFQKLDADMMVSVLLDLRRQKIKAIPIHDSAIVQRRHGPALKGAMERAFRKLIRRLWPADAAQSVEDAFRNVTLVSEDAPEFVSQVSEPIEEKGVSGLQGWIDGAPARPVRSTGGQITVRRWFPQSIVRPWMPAGRGALP